MAILRAKLPALRMHPGLKRLRIAPCPTRKQIAVPCGSENPNYFTRSCRRGTAIAADPLPTLTGFLLMTANPLLTPTHFGSIDVANRVVLAPLTRNRAGAGDVPTDLTVTYYAQRATGGLLISEATQILPEGKGYPNTPGIHSPEQIAGWKKVTDAVHAAGGLVYCDGANFNAIVGRVRPGDLGIDAMHINLHKTFSTPHGGGGPGSGPVVFSKALSPFAPLPFVEKTDDGFHLVEEETAGEHHAGAFGRMVAFHGQMGMFTRALTYILSHGADGLRQVSEDAVLNANYILRSLDKTLDAPFGGSGPCMHEALFSDENLADGFSTIDVAKGLIDEGFHPMTMYFPLVVHGAMLIEPTETESKAALDQFIVALRSVAERAKAGDVSLKSAPHFAPRSRLDETLAARKPILVWKDPGLAQAAE
eukprot:gene21061-21830_t